jgi:non-ribosomal peptide synthetase component F
VLEIGCGVGLVLERYATALFDRETVERWGGYLRQALSEMARSPEQLAAAVPLLSDEERHKLLVDWNETAADYPRDKCVHELFEDQAARTPDAIAVECGEQSLSYSELNLRANRLAQHLRGWAPARTSAWRSASLAASRWWWLSWRC